MKKKSGVKKTPTSTNTARVASKSKVLKPSRASGPTFDQLFSRLDDVMSDTPDFRDYDGDTGLNINTLSVQQNLLGDVGMLKARTQAIADELKSLRSAVLELAGSLSGRKPVQREGRF